MKSLRFSIILIALCAALVGANAQPTSNFPTISVPAMVAADPQSASRYVADHFWDRYNFARFDSAYTAEATEQGFAQFAAVLARIPFDIAAKAVTKMMTEAAASAGCYERFLELAEKYFYDPNSPLRNDEFFIPVLQHAIASNRTDPTMKIRYRELLKSVDKNRPTTTATDFAYTLADGSSHRMKDIKADLLLLYFYNAGCPNCREVKNFLEASEVVKFYKERGYMKVLAVYPDADLKEWRRWLPENPSWWISSYDRGEKIRNGELYDLKAIPTIYLLDHDKRVILKDPTPEVLEEVLRSM